jgi:hypothetical protein
MTMLTSPAAIQSMLLVLLVTLVCGFTAIPVASTRDPSSAAVPHPARSKHVDITLVGVQHNPGHAATDPRALFPQKSARSPDRSRRLSAKQKKKQAKAAAAAAAAAEAKVGAAAIAGTGEWETISDKCACTQNTNNVVSFSSVGITISKEDCQNRCLVRCAFFDRSLH